MSHADNSDALHGLIRIFFLAFLIGFIRKVRKKLLQVCLGGNAVDGHDLHHPAVQLTVPDIALRERLDLQCCDQQVTSFHGIAEEVIVVDIVDLETGVFRVIGRSHTGLAFFQFFCHREQTLGGSLDRTEVDVCTDKAPAEFHGNCLRGAAAHKAVKNKVARIRTSLNNTLK